MNCLSSLTHAGKDSSSLVPARDNAGIENGWVDDESNKQQAPTQPSTTSLPSLQQMSLLGRENWKIEIFVLKFPESSSLDFQDYREI